MTRDEYELLRANVAATCLLASAYLGEEQLEQ